MDTNKKSTFVQQGNDSAAEQEKTPVFQVQTGLRAGGRSDEAWAIANFDKIESFFNNLQARFGTNV